MKVADEFPGLYSQPWFKPLILSFLILEHQPLLLLPKVWISILTWSFFLIKYIFLILLNQNSKSYHERDTFLKHIFLFLCIKVYLWNFIKMQTLWEKYYGNRIDHLCILFINTKLFKILKTYMNKLLGALEESNLTSLSTCKDRLYSNRGKTWTMRQWVQQVVNRIPELQVYIIQGYIPQNI